MHCFVVDEDDDDNVAYLVDRVSCSLRPVGDHTTTERVTHQLVGCRVLEIILCPYLRPESRPIVAAP